MTVDFYAQEASFKCTLPQAAERINISNLVLEWQSGETKEVTIEIVWDFSGMPIVYLSDLSIF